MSTYVTLCDISHYSFTLHTMTINVPVKEILRIILREIISKLCKVKTKIATSCWLAINRTLEPTKKKKRSPKTKEKSQWDGRRGAIMIKSNLIPLGGQTTNWKTVVPKKFSLCRAGSEPHVRLPSLGIQQRDWEHAGNLTLKGSRIWLQGFHRTGGNRDSTLRKHKQNLACTRTQGKGAVTSHKTKPNLPASVGVSGGGMGWPWLATGTGALLKRESESEVAQSCPTLWPHGHM